MRLFGFDITRAVNVTANPGNTQKALSRIKYETFDRTKQGIQDWRNAIDDAEDVDRPNNEELMRLYRELVMDPHLSAIMDTLLYQVRSNKFEVYSGDEVDEEKTEIFTGRWFNEFIRYCIEARYYGFSYIQFDGVKDDDFTSISAVPRQYVIPQWQMLKKRPHDYKGIPIDKPPLNKWNLFLGDKYDLGLLCKAAPLVIYKREVMQFWASYNELFGQPLRVGKTNMTDKNRVDNMTAAMENMSFSSWMVTDVEDTIEMIATNGMSGQLTYEKFIRLIDEQISKLFAGQTMVLDNGSSRSQSEVHERNMTSFVNSMMTEIEYAVNTQLIPLMVGLGIKISPDDRFCWAQSENMTKMDKAEMIAKISPYYKLDRDFIERTLDVELREENEDLDRGNDPATPSGVAAMQDTAAYYREAINNLHRNG